MFAAMVRQLSAGLIGAIVGGVLAWLLEYAGYSPLAIYLLLAALFATWLFVESNGGIVFDAAGRFRIPLVSVSKVPLVVLLTAIYFAIEAAFYINPRDYAYLPLVPLVIASTALFGFGSGLLATILSVLVADFFFVPDIYSFEIHEWEDAVGLAIFAIAGSILAFGMHKVFQSGTARRTDE